MGRILSAAMKEFVVNPRKINYNRHVQSVYYRRIRRYAKESLEDLALLAEKLPEKEQERIFNNETLRAFINALFSTDVDTRIKESKLRILKLCLLFLGLPWQSLANWIIPELAWIIRREESNEPIASIKTLLYTRFESYKPE